MYLSHFDTGEHAGNMKSLFTVVINRKKTHVVVCFVYFSIKCLLPSPSAAKNRHKNTEILGCRPSLTNENTPSYLVSVFFIKWYFSENGNSLIMFQNSLFFFLNLQTHISRLPPGTVPGQCLAIEGGVCRLMSVAD